MRVSVVIPCYNGARFLRESLESVRVQTRPPEQVIVVDDGSTDDSAEIAASTPGVELIRQANLGACLARNAGGWRVALLTPAIGTTIGCNLSRTYGSCGERLLPGSVALSCATDPDGAVHPSLDLRMVNIRF